MTRKVTAALIGFLILNQLIIPKGLTENDISSEDLNCRNCNIILITIETLRADHVGCYGYKRNTTPNLDKIAGEGFRFINAYSSAPATMPAIATIMNNIMYSNNDDSKEMNRRFLKGSPTLPEILKSKGYLTAIFSNHPFYNGPNYYTYQKKFDEKITFSINENSVTDHLLANKIIKWLEENHQKKFFFWAHFYDPHYNYNPLPEYESLFGFSWDSCGKIFNGINVMQMDYDDTPLNSREMDCLVSLYDAEVYHTDKQVGRVLREVERLGIGDKTLVIITSDHGEEFRERGKLLHEKTLYNELLHVPLIIKVPQKEPKVISREIGTRDIFEIITNIDQPEMADYGRPVISRTYHGLHESGKPNEFAIVQQGMKYMFNPTSGEKKIFNLLKDPQEKQNVIGDMQLKEVKKDIMSKMNDWIANNKIKGDPNFIFPKEENGELDILRSLGYMQ
jgi:arylsulfatase A-like enzyme